MVSFLFWGNLHIFVIIFECFSCGQGFQFTQRRFLILKCTQRRNCCCFISDLFFFCILQNDGWKIEQFFLIQQEKLILAFIPYYQRYTRVTPSLLFLDEFSTKDYPWIVRKSIFGRKRMDIELGTYCIGLLSDRLCILKAFIHNANLNRVGQVQKLGQFVDVVQFISLDIWQLFHEIYPIFEEVLNELGLFGKLGMRQKICDRVNTFKYFVHQILQFFDFYTQFICGFAFKQVHSRIGNDGPDKKLEEGIKMYGGCFDSPGVLPPVRMGIGFFKVKKMHQIIQFVLNRFKLTELAFRDIPGLGVAEEGLQLNIN